MKISIEILPFMKHIFCVFRMSTKAVTEHLKSVDSCLKNKYSNFHLWRANTELPLYSITLDEKPENSKTSSNALRKVHLVNTIFLFESFYDWNYVPNSYEMNSYWKKTTIFPFKCMNVNCAKCEKRIKFNSVRCALYQLLVLPDFTWITVTWVCYQFRNTWCIWKFIEIPLWNHFIELNTSGKISNTKLSTNSAIDTQSLP